MRFVVATNNAGKIREIRHTLPEHEFVTLKELGIDSDPEENGATYFDNALIKAKAALDATGIASVADDSGLEIDALGGAPGIHSARYSFPGDRKAKVLRETRNAQSRKARFVCSIVCVFPNGDIIEGYGTVEGEIAGEPRGGGGFGYDPVFYLSEYGLTMAEIPEDLKNRISHRAVALRDFSRKLDLYLEAENA